MSAQGTGEAGTRTRWPRHLAVVAGVALALLLSLPFLIVDVVPRDWSVGLAEGAVIARDGQWPVVFNYGPLGYLMRPVAYDRSLWLQGMIYGILRVLVFHVATVAVLVMLRRPWTHIAIALVGTTVALQSLSIFEYALHFALQVLIIGDLWRPQHRGRWLRLAICILMAITAAEVYAKFSQGILTISMASVYVIWLLWYRQFLWAVAVVLTVAIGLILPGILVLNDGASLAMFWRGSLAIVTAYSDGMQLVRPREGLLLAGLLALGAATAGLAAWPIRWGVGRSFVALLLCLPLLGIAYRHGIIRADGHMSILYASWGVVAGCMLLGRWRRPRYRTVAYGAFGLLGAVMFSAAMYEAYGEFRQTPGDVMRERFAQIQRTIRVLPQAGWDADQERTREAMIQHFDLRYDSREAIRGKRVECVFSELATINYLDAVWTPRPVFQSYQASNLELAKLNANVVESEDYADIVMIELAQVDFRYVFHDEPLLVRSFLTHYRPMWRDGRYVLFERRESPFRAELTTVATATARLNEPIPLPRSDGQPVFATFTLPYSTVGRLKRATWKAWPTFVHFHTDDGPVGPFRVSPAVAPLGLLASHTILGPDDVLAFYEGRLPATVRAIEFRCDAPGDYAAEFEVQFQHIRLSRD